MSEESKRFIGGEMRENRITIIHDNGFAVDVVKEKMRN